MRATRPARHRSGIPTLGAALLLAGLSSGCANLQHRTTAELRAESDQYFNQGRYDEALPLYDEVLRREETDLHARTYRGVSHERTGSTQAALDDYGAVRDARALLYSANLNIRSGRLGDAEADLAALRDMPLGARETVAQLTLLGTLRLEQGQHAMALQSLERAIEEGGRIADHGVRAHLRDAHYNAAQACYFLGDFPGAYEHFLAYAMGGDAERAARAAAEGRWDQPLPVSGEDAYMLGLLAYLSGDFPGADVHLAQADPDLVARGAEILQDPKFGASRRELDK